MAHQNNFSSTMEFASSSFTPNNKAASLSPAIAVKDFGDVGQQLKLCELKIKKGFDNSIMRKQQVAQRAKECQIAPNIEELRRKAHEENTQAWEKYLLK